MPLLDPEDDHVPIPHRIEEMSKRDFLRIQKTKGWGSKWGGELFERHGMSLGGGFKKKNHPYLGK